MDELIKRQDALDALCDACTLASVKSECIFKNLESCMDHNAILDVPAVEERWIPCSERLPEENDYKSCIECLDGAVWYFTENGTMGLGYYYKSTKEWSTTDDLKTDGKVIAWMPLPEPYKGEQE